MQDFTSDSNRQQSTVSLAFLRLSQVFKIIFGVKYVDEYLDIDYYLNVKAIYVLIKAKS